MQKVPHTLSSNPTENGKIMLESNVICLQVESNAGNKEVTVENGDETLSGKVQKVPDTLSRNPTENAKIMVESNVSCIHSSSGK